MNSTLDKIESYVSNLGLPSLAVASISSTDLLPVDPSNISGKELADKLFEYSGYVSYLDAELGRIDAERILLTSDLDLVVDAIALGHKLSKAKAKSQAVQNDGNLMKINRRLVELEALYARVHGMREGFAVRMQATSREVSRRNQAP